MYVLDPLARTLCFSDGKEGMAFANNQWGNRCSDLSYSPAGNGNFVAGIESNRVAAIVDLGTPNDLRERYGFEDAENGGVGFASLRLEGGKITILQEDNSKPNQTGNRLRKVLNSFRSQGIRQCADQVGPHLPRADCGYQRQEFPTDRQADGDCVSS